MKIIQYTPDKSHQWNDFVKTSKNGFFMFDRKYMDYHADRFTDSSLMVYDESGKLIALFPANRVSGTLYSHQGLTFGGFITGKRMRCPMMIETFATLKNYAQENKIDTIIYKSIPYFYHAQPAQEDIYALFQAEAQLTRVDTSSTLDYTNQRYAFSSSRKSGIKKAKKHGLNIQKSTDFEYFFYMMNDVLRTKHNTSATHTAQEMTKLHGAFPKNITLYGCFQNNTMLAGIITYETPVTIHTQYIAASTLGKEYGAADLILDELINTTYTHKKYFDFGISTEDQGRTLNTMLIDQKEGTGARSTVHLTFELNYKKLRKND